MGKKLLTLNIGASTVVLAEYDIGGRAPTLLKYGKSQLAAALDSGNASTILAPALHEIMRANGIKPGKVALSISGQMAFLRNAAIPMAGGKERFETLIRYEIEQNIPFPIDEMVCDSQVLGDMPNGDKSVVVVATKVDQIEKIVEAVKSAGFEPEIIDVAPISIINLLRSSPAYDGGCAILLDIGAKTTSLSIIEGEKIYNRAIPVAGGTITKEIAQTLGCSLDDAESYKCQNAYVSMGGVTEDEDETLDHVSKICRSVMTRLHAEITRSVNFYRSQQGGSMPTKLYLTGGCALLPQIADFFQDSLQIEVGFLNPFDVAAVGSSCDTSQIESDSVFLAATTGLALHAGGAASISINLLPPSITEARKEAARIPFVAIGAAAFAVAGALWYFVQLGELDQLDARKNEFEPKLNVLTAHKNYNEAQKKKCDAKVAEAKEFMKHISRHDDYLKRLKDVRGVVESVGMWIGKWEEVKIKDAEKKEEVKERKPRNRRDRRAANKSNAQVEVPGVRLTLYKWGDDDADVDGIIDAFRKKGIFVTPGPTDTIVEPNVSTSACLKAYQFDWKLNEKEAESK
ncbi:MAG: type IV pilus assembly protein PilM [Kiritimatiellae bacterium]|nr:type IV pilus assembly protein PilM [Kiritimatiellia bacterium]